MTPKTVLIACGIFYDELRAVLPDGDIEVVWLDTALHADPVLLEQQLTCAGRKALEKTGPAPNRVRLLIGSGCHPDMSRIAESCCVCTAPFKNCIEAFAGDRQPELEDGRSMIITPGWVRNWPGRASRFGWDTTDMRIQHGRYDRIVLLDPGINPVSEQEIFDLFELVQVPIEVQPLDLEYFKQKVRDVLS